MKIGRDSIVGPVFSLVPLFYNSLSCLYKMKTAEEEVDLTNIDNDAQNILYQRSAKSLIGPGVNCRTHTHHLRAKEQVCSHINTMHN